MDIDRSKIVSLIIGITGIYSIYFSLGIKQEAVIKRSYHNDITGQQQRFDYPESQLLFSALSAYLMSMVYNRIKYSYKQYTCIPLIHGLRSGGAVTISAITYSYAILLTNFPVVMMIRSCNVLSVVLVGVLFSGVKDTTIKLGGNKIIIALLATTGMIIFKVYDPNTIGSTHKTQIAGIGLILMSLLADGFLPDFQAVIKSQFKPHPTIMLEHINKWATILCLIFTIITGNFIPMVKFIFQHGNTLIDLLIIGLLSASGQFFVYHIQSIFKQHIVPLIVGTRKIFTVGLSILYYNHQISSMQLLGLLLVFSISIYQFKTQSSKTKSINPPPQKQVQNNLSHINQIKKE